MKYYVKIVVEKFLTYEVEAYSEKEATDKVYYGEVEPYDRETLTDVIECYPIETEAKDIYTYCGWGEPDTPMEGCALF
jgi:hypothetical protein